MLEKMSCNIDKVVLFCKMLGFKIHKNETKFGVIQI